MISILSFTSSRSTKEDLHTLYAGIRLRRLVTLKSAAAAVPHGLCRRSQVADETGGNDSREDSHSF
jgi:hypothetical protein